MVTGDFSTLVIYYPFRYCSLYDSSSSQNIRWKKAWPFTVRNAFFLNPWGCRELSHQQWNHNRNIVWPNYSAVCGDRAHQKGERSIISLFKHWYKPMIPRAEFVWPVWTWRYIHLLCHINVVFTKYLRCHPSPFPPWRCGCPAPPPHVFAFLLETIFRAPLPLLLLAAIASSLSFKIFWFYPVGVVAFRIFQSCLPAPRSTLACYFPVSVIFWSLCPFVQTLRLLPSPCIGDGVVGMCLFLDVVP